MILLLDTCAAIWLGIKAPMLPEAVQQIESAAIQASVYVSPITAWEIGLLASRDRSGKEFDPDAETWFARFMAQPGLAPAPFDHAIAIASTCLPDWTHRDPADRFLVATARHLGAALVTRDDRILSYAAAGHVRAIAC